MYQQLYDNFDSIFSPTQCGFVSQCKALPYSYAREVHRIHVHT